MRAKRVPTKAVVFDFDETLIRSEAKVHVYKNDRKIKSISPREFNFYKKGRGERFSFEEFEDPRILLNGTKHKMWEALERLYFKTSNGEEPVDIFILTTRKPKMVSTIYTYMKRNDILIPEENIIAIGEHDDSKADMTEKKKNVLKGLKDKYESILFYDDSPDNIRLAGQIGGIDTILVDWK